MESLRLLEPKIAKIVLLTYQLRKFSNILAQPPSYLCVGKFGQNLKSLWLLEPKIAKIVLLTYQLRKFPKILAQTPRYFYIGTSCQNLESLGLLEPKLGRIVPLSYQPFRHIVVDTEFRLAKLSAPFSHSVPFRAIPRHSAPFSHFGLSDTL